MMFVNVGLCLAILAIVFTLMSKLDDVSKRLRHLEAVILPPEEAPAEAAAEQPVEAAPAE